MIYDLCIHVGNRINDVEFFLKVKKEFEKYNLNIQLFTEEPIQYFDLLDSEHIVVLPLKAEKNYSVAENIQYLSSLGISNFRSLYFTEQKKKQYSEKKSIEITNQKINNCRSLYKNVDTAKYYLTFASDELIVNVFRVFAKQNNGKILYSRYSVMPERIFISKSRDFILPKQQINFTEEDKKWANDYIENYTQKKTILWANPEDRNPKISQLFSNYFLKIFNVNKIIKLFANKRWRIAFFSLKVHTTRLINKYLSNFLYSKNCKNQFIYFPLHFPIDSQLTNRALPFLNQSCVVETVSYYLPFQYTLLVKEHPLARGYSQYLDLKHIANLPNVKLVHPYKNSHDLIKKAKAIVVINSSVGYEALMYKKPVITLGKSFYRGHDLTIDIESLYHLKDAFDRVENFTVDKSRFIDFVCKIKANTFDIKFSDISENNEKIISDFVYNLSCYFKNIN